MSSPLLSKDNARSPRVPIRTMPKSSSSLEVTATGRPSYERTTISSDASSRLLLSMRTVASRGVRSWCRKRTDKAIVSPSPSLRGSSGAETTVKEGASSATPSGGA